MTVTYAISLADPTGNTLADLTRFTRLTYTRVVNDVGECEIILPFFIPPDQLPVPDGQLSIFRQDEDDTTATLVTDTIWFLKEVFYQRDAEGAVTTTLRGVTPLAVYGDPGRIVDDYSGGARATWTDTAGNIIRQMVRDHAGGNATDPNRDLSAWIDVEPNSNDGVSMTQSAAWDVLLSTMQTVAGTSTYWGSYLAFDVVCTPVLPWTFRVFAGQRGTDRRITSGNAPLLLSTNTASLGEATLTLNYRHEVTVVRVGGQGEGAERLTASAVATDRTGLSPFGWKERFVNATNLTTSAELGYAAQSELVRTRPRVAATARILSSDGARYGVDWGWGDLVTAEIFDYRFDARIDAISVTVDSDNDEVIDAWIQGEWYT